MMVAQGISDSDGAGQTSCLTGAPSKPSAAGCMRLSHWDIPPFISVLTHLIHKPFHTLV